MADCVVVGGGLGGLAAAIRLRARGENVLLLEQGERLGGKCNRREREGFVFDTGPSVLTMPFVLDELFAAAGRERADYLTLEPVEPGCQYRFADGTVFEAPGTLAAFEEAVARTFPGEERGFARFMDYTRKLWEISGSAFLFHPLGAGLLRRLDWRKAISGLAALRPTRMHREVRRYFRDPRLIQLFDRFATYNGSDPYRTPATFNVISYVELAFGSWRCRGGMYELVEALERLAREIGVEVRTGAGVERLEFANAEKVSALHLAEGERIATNRVVLNADALTALTGSLMADHPNAQRWQRRFSHREASGSGYVLLMALERRFPELAVHNVLFSDDYPREFREIFSHPTAPHDPTLYIHIPGRHEPSFAPEGKEGWFVLINAPSTDRLPDWPTDYPERLLARLSERLAPLGFRAADIRWHEARSPHYFAHEYSAWRGSLYGASSNNPLAAFLRVRNAGPCENLAFAGGSAHPGGGIPLVLLSGKMAAESLA
ncbi:MAG: phytoene desaturase family protein [Verrucomicrobiota bacterium]